MRKSSLRVTLGDLMAVKKKEKGAAGRLRGRYLFRAAVRLILEYMDWIDGAETAIEDDDDIAVNVRISRHRKTQDKKGLTLQDRSALLTKTHERSKDEKIRIMSLIKCLRAFGKYPDNLKQSVASVCRYQYLRAGRVIVRQGHPANALYYIVNGEVTLTKIITDRVTGDAKEVTIGTMGPGDMFGEIALLHSIPRTTTVTSKTPIDLFYIIKSDFDRILKNILLCDWNILQDALITFNYFKAWDESTIRECCILSKIKNYAPNEVLLGDGKGMVNYVYFVLAGECRLIEHMIIHEEKTLNKVKYRLYKSHQNVPQSVSDIRRITGRGSSRQTAPRPSIQVEDQGIEEDDDYPADDGELILSSGTSGNVDNERMSIVTTTLQDVVNQWHEITQVAAMLMREPSISSQTAYPTGVRTVFMQVCKFYRGACFGLGEEMRNRRIVSISPVRCLLVPRYWLLEHNRANIWERVKLFMESKYPTRDELFKQFVNNRRWTNFKRHLVSEIIDNGKKLPNDTTIHDVPYSTRINDETESR